MKPFPFPFLYLASQSPRRAAILRQMGVRFESLVFDPTRPEDREVDETPYAKEPAQDYVLRISREKAHAGMARRKLLARPTAPVLSADTTLALSGQIIGKPRDAEHAVAILQQLSGREHEVLTAVTLLGQDYEDSRLSVSRVRFKTLTEQEIDAYIQTGEPFDKAGAYGIQGYAALWISNIQGSYTGIMGLPIFEVGDMLDHFSRHTEQARI